MADTQHLVTWTVNGVCLGLVPAVGEAAGWGEGVLELDVPGGVITPRSPHAT